MAKGESGEKLIGGLEENEAKIIWNENEAIEESEMSKKKKAEEKWKLMSKKKKMAKMKMSVIGESWS